MSVGWIGESAVVEESRKGCIAWMACLRLRRDDGVGREGSDLIGAEEEEDEAAAEEDIVRSWTVIDAAEPGIRLMSAGALRKEVDSFEAASAGATAPDFVAMMFA